MQVVVGWCLPGAKGRAVIGNGCAVELAYKFHLIAIIEFAEVSVLDGVGRVRAKEEELGVLCRKVEDP